MDDIIGCIIEVFGQLLEEILRSIRPSRKRKWALTVFYSIIWLGITAFFVYSAVALSNEKNTIGTIVMSVIAGLAFLLLGFFIVRGHRKNWKNY